MQTFKLADHSPNANSASMLLKLTLRSIQDLHEVCTQSTTAYQSAPLQISFDTEVRDTHLGGLTRPYLDLDRKVLVDPRFMSLNLLQSLILPASPAIGHDNSDNLESHFWILVFLTSSMNSKLEGVSTEATPDLVWMRDPLSSHAFQAKMKTLFDVDSMLATSWWSGVDPLLLKVLSSLQSIFKRRYLSRIALKRSRTLREQSSDFEHDTTAISRVLLDSLAQIDRQDAGLSLHCEGHVRQFVDDDSADEDFDDDDEATFHLYEVTSYSHAKVIHVQN